MVSGVVTYRNDVFTGALPGGVVRNSRRCARNHLPMRRCRGWVSPPARGSHVCSMPSRALPDLAPDDYIIMDQSTAGLDNKKNFDEVRRPRGGSGMKQRQARAAFRVLLGAA